MNLLKNLSLQELLKGALHTFLLYPLVLLSAAVGTVSAMVLVEVPYEERPEAVYLEKLIIVSALGLILFFTLELVTRKYKLSFLKRLLLWLGGLVFLGVYYYLLPEELQQKHAIRLFLLTLTLHLMASYAMFFNLKEENAFWQFNKALFLRILTAALYSAVLYLGLALAILAVDNLFSVSVDDDLYAKLWLFMVGIFNTWFFLAGVPTNVQELEESHIYPKGLKVFTQFVLLPLVTLYLVILYLYLGKIVVQWEWPEGWVSVLVLCFSIAGILSLLLIHPIRNQEGSTWIRVFAKWFYRALFPLIILLMLAIWRRISEYGITEARYFVLVLALWLFCTALYFLLSPRKNIKFIPVTLSLVALLTAFGPFNAFQVSEWNQVSRLQKMLEQNKVLVNGKIKPASTNIPDSTEVQISSILYYLDKTHGLESIKPWFTIDLDSAFAAHDDSLKSKRVYYPDHAALAMKLMGMEYNLYLDVINDNVQSFYVKSEQQTVTDIRGYDYISDIYLTARIDSESKRLIDSAGFRFGSDSLAVSYIPGKEQLVFKSGGRAEVMPLPPLYERLLKIKGQELTEEQLTITLPGAAFDVKLLLQHLSIRNEKGKDELESMNARLLYRKKK